jgi:hypothetical protein
LALAFRKILLQGMTGAPGTDTPALGTVFQVDGLGEGMYAGNVQTNGNPNVTGTVSKGAGSFRLCVNRSACFFASYTSARKCMSGLQTL